MFGLTTKQTASVITGCFVLVFSCVSWANSTVKTEEQKEAQQKLLAIQKQISQQSQQIDRNKTELSLIELAIEDTDRTIGDTTKRLKKLDKQLRDGRVKLGELRKRQAKLENDKKQQLDILAEQIKSAYQTGKHDYLMMLLNQESPAKLERALAYYQYLNKARVESVDELKQTITALESNKQALLEQQNALASLSNEQRAKAAELQSLRKQQKASFKQLAKQLKTEQDKLNRLKHSETSLNQLIETLASAVAKLPIFDNLAGLKAYQGNLPWPATGKVQNLFGKRKRGPIRWRGTVIDSKLGAPVKNIHAGQVIFSDWMKGFGLVLVVDHGEGYMSLYGHNQSLLKDVGDAVEAGETIALVGQSGGQSYPNLYFELRHQGKPVNPKSWCK
ncbi:hypothetical protein C2869_08725 [Saccharobesus litoralis]|uniref:M23ase beta-sheet core domain-containing protein n=1 Tax=Saccharobesus litoralis TaxID=2172099 RepID=A0A2S0VQK7_9ALTE|nr:peptidoglycan DD-metalloendopeptidase family protein [Saccharobesus litoralis]AWB66506.1 hypothetical protein C2869_08725 [Saccharobesus litoralis]